ncbi:MAG: DUF2505 domain-containing protein [Labedaea sp.]
MSTRFEHRATFSAPAVAVYSALVDRAYLEERLQDLGGKGAALVEHITSGDEVHLRLRQGVAAERLPGAVRSLLKGDLIVEREERWRADGAGFAAVGKATIDGVPGEIHSRTRLADRPDGDSEQVTTAEVRVGIPLVGGKLESVIAQHVGKLMAAESEFTGKWLARHGS